MSVEQLRDALRRRASESSLRVVADETGMSPSGLHSFLHGTTPQYGTIRKIRNWYIREATRAPGPPTVVTMRAAVELLVEHLPGSRRRAAAEEILKTVRRVTHESDVPSPTWIDYLP